MAPASGAAAPSLSFFSRAWGWCVWACYLLCAAARDPVRYAAIVDTLIFFCLGAGVLTIYADLALGARAYYPSAYLVTRGVVQIAIGAVLIALRPRAAAPTTAYGA